MLKKPNKTHLPENSSGAVEGTAPTREISQGSMEPTEVSKGKWVPIFERTVTYQDLNDRNDSALKEIFYPRGNLVQRELERSERAKRLELNL